ncbi:MAG: hydrogenase maturation nickel metallochaperone HypA [Desulfobacteraceae bacterium 4572_19]|nr:MAG: hydrogenase maturation nickel metallochaperone HypA [Desulfobacteraceae bacterium 4572_19]
MHEMGIATQLVEIAISSIPDDMEGVHIEAVNVEVGKLSSIVPDSLSFCFDIAVKDTVIDGAKLNIKQLPVTALCKECHHTFTMDEPLFLCPECKCSSIDLLSGRELDIISMDVAQ